MLLPPPELERAWLAQLQYEHARICHERRLKLQPPVIRLSGSGKRLGAWSGTKREISLASAFIARYEWPVVLQIFKHEMAHQLCAELWGMTHAGHGPDFRRACAILGVESPFQSASVDLDAGLQLTLQARERPDPQQRLHARVRKLLALADSDNEHEAALALARASALLARHRLDAAAKHEQASFVHESINTGQQLMPAHRNAICSLLLAHFAVRVVIASTYDQHRNIRVKTVELLGRSQDVAAASHCYHFLEERLATLWRAQRHRFGVGGRQARTSYFLGLLAGFRQALANAEPRPAQATCPAEALALSEKHLERFVEERFPRLRARRRPGARVARAPYNAALQEGRQLRMRHPLADSGTGVCALPAPAKGSGD